MQRLLWLVPQSAIVAGALWFEHVRASEAHEPPQVGFAFGLGVVLALMFSALLARVIDGGRFGWKASAPPKISRAEKIEGNATVVKWAGWWVAGMLLLYGTVALVGPDGSKVTGAGMITGAIVILIVSRLFRTWLLASIASPLPVVGDGAPRLGGGDIYQPNEIAGGRHAAGSGRRQLPEPRRRLGHSE